MAKTIYDYIDTANQDFLTKNAGQYLQDKVGGKNYLVDASGLKEIGDMPVNTKPGQYITFDLTSGLVDKEMQAKGSFSNSEGFKYFNPVANEAAKISTNNFGMGKTIDAGQYTGETAGYSSGGALLYKLKDGSVTATPPAGTPKEEFKSQEQLKDMGSEKATGGVVTKEMQAAADLAASTNIKAETLAKPGIAALISSGRQFTETDAKNFAYANGDDNWQQYVGGVGGQSNPLYIGATNWTSLQKKYTPYQLSQATVKTNNGIYWKADANIGDIPREDPSITINNDTKAISDAITGAKASADKMTNEAAKTAAKATVEADTVDYKAATIADLTDKYDADSAEAIYNELFNTSEMKTAQSEVSSLKAKLDEYDQQMDELKDDIRREVEGEASESYITSLATVRGEKILKQKRSVQRDYDTALAVYNGLKENATNLLTVRTKDVDSRYNRLFQSLQLQLQTEGQNFNQETALANIAMSLPEGRSMTVNGTVVKGLKENDNLNVVQFTEADGKTYVLGVDKKTGAQKYKTFIGTAKVAGSGTAAESVDLQTALYWLSLSKDKDGLPDLGKIPEKYRAGVVDVVSKNQANIPAAEKSLVEKALDWWDKNIW